MYASMYVCMYVCKYVSVCYGVGPGRHRWCGREPVRARFGGLCLAIWFDMLWKVGQV